MSASRRVVTLLAVLASFAVAPPGAAVADTAPSLESYDRLAPDRAWRDSIRLGAVPSGLDGEGVTVAVLDTGATRHPDLGTRVRARIDLTPDADGYDRYGHGTHMAGIVAGDGRASAGRWAGVAPKASLVTAKVAGWNGATDVSAVLPALEWIAVHRARHGIRVVNLSYGTDSTQSWREAALDHAVERLWKAGIVVVVSAGNRGGGGSKIDKPADDPYVVTVGAADTRATATLADDRVAPFSSRGPTHDGVAKPDLIAPGVSIPSHRAPGSTADGLRPAARLESQYFKGTGTSQAAAVVSGVVARMLEARPTLTPDEVKATLVGTTSALRGAEGAGAGLVDAAAAVGAAKAGRFAGARQAGLPASTGRGPIDAARGAFKPYTDWKERGKPEQLSGEFDALGNPWNAAAWAARAWTATTWSTSPWKRHTAVATGWGTASQPARWGGMGWDEPTWTAKHWGDTGWDPGEWTAKHWGASLWNSR